MKWFSNLFRKYHGYVFCCGVIIVIVSLVLCSSKYSSNKLWNWCDAMTAVVNIVGLFGLCFIYLQWRTKQSVNKAEFLKKLIDNFGTDESKNILTVVDDSESVEEWINSSKKSSENRLALNSFLRFLSYICYLKHNDLIDIKEFSMFEVYIVKILVDENIKRHILKECDRLGVEDVNAVGNPFYSLFEFAKNRHLDDAVYLEGKHIEDNSKWNAEGLGSIGVEETSYDNEISEDEFQRPTIIIRINRLWHKGITEEALYEATRKWWRVRYDVAKDYKIALSVADGIVREVYEIDEWLGHDGKKPPDCEKERMQFKGKVAPDAIRNRFLGKSVRGLFKQGDAYPVRYFGVKA